MTYTKGNQFCGSSVDGTMAVPNSPSEGSFMASYIESYTETGYANVTTRGQLGGRTTREHRFIQWIDGSVMMDGYFTNDLDNDKFWFTTAWTPGQCESMQAIT